MKSLSFFVWKSILCLFLLLQLLLVKSTASRSRRELHPAFILPQTLFSNAPQQQQRCSASHTNLIPIGGTNSRIPFLTRVLVSPLNTDDVGGEEANRKEKWNDQHLAHNIGEVHEETVSELQESEDAAAWDAHDCDDEGMEAAAEERAVMIAAEMMHKMKEQKKSDGGKTDNWNNEHLAHGVADVHEENAQEMLDSEDAAAWDAHDCSDAGMESAAEERAVMLAAEMTHRMKDSATKKK